MNTTNLKLLLILSILLSYNVVMAINKEDRKITITRTETPPTIDGVLDDAAWENATIADDWSQFEPYNGKAPSYPSEVRVVYDDDAIYFAAKMYDPHPDSIYTTLGKRDVGGDLNADLFTILIGPFNDGYNMLEFMVSASGVQSDAKHTGHRGDINWNAVWDSEVRIVEDGWIAEYKIPYSALRFPKKEEQVWGIHFFRHIRRYREWSSWQYVSNQANGFIQYAAEINGIKNIEPPLRLSLSPYVSAYIENSQEADAWGRSLNGGLDLKLGLSESFTLDATLIPDFGQVQSDDEILNLSPFEVRYDEKRQFFTEGTELFNKGEIFYSRRIGSRPKFSGDAYDDLQENEEVSKSPSETSMINATKVSGRTKGGLGIGVFNAMTSEATSTITDTITGVSRNYRTQGFTNYNMLVLDQSLPNNSYIALANTNVNIWEDNYMANVTATDFQFQDKNAYYQFEGRGVFSNINHDSTTTGHGYYLSLRKIHGKFKFRYHHSVESKYYNINDFGYIRSPNEFNNRGEVSYSIQDPFSIFMNLNNSFEIEYNQLYEPRAFSELQFNWHTRATYKNFMSNGFFIAYKPKETIDFFEAREDGYQYNRPRILYLNTWFSTDYRKKIAIDFRVGGRKSFDNNEKEISFDIEPRVRFNDKFMITHEFEIENDINNHGYVDKEYDDNDILTNIVFGERDILTLTNTFESYYIFTNNMSVSIRARHYWRKVEYADYFYLKDDGHLNNSLGLDYFDETQNVNYNVFNIDFTYMWNFAPGSELTIVWKNAILDADEELVNRYFTNFRNTLSSPQTNSISFKVLYYLDYQSLR